MKSIYLLLILLFFKASFCNAQQNFKIKWQKTYGGSKTEVANRIEQTSDSGFIVCGYTASKDKQVSGYHGGDDAWVIRTTKRGKLIWQKALGGSDYDEITSIKPLATGGYIACGYSISNDGDIHENHGSWDAWLCKLDFEGNIIWSKTYGGSSIDIAYGIVNTNDGGYTFAGSTSSVDGDVTGNNGEDDIWIVKVDSSGNIQWQRCYGGTFSEVGYSIQTAFSNGYIISGVTASLDGDVLDHHNTSNNYTDEWVLRIDSSGKLLWENALGGANEDVAYDAEPTLDGGFIVAGFSNSIGGDIGNNKGEKDAWITKLDSVGNLQWQKNLGGSKDDKGNSVKQVRDGGYIVAISTYSDDGQVNDLHGKDDIWVVKLNNRGTIEQSITLGGSDYEEATCIQQTFDGGFVVCGGTTSSDGDVTKNRGQDDFWVVRLEPSVIDSNVLVENKMIFSAGKTLSNTESFLSISPTITTGTFQLNLQTTNTNTDQATIQVFNSIGQLVLSKQVVVNDGMLNMAITLDAAVPKGIYFIRLKTGNQQYSGKVVYQ
ncbi:MAG: T9SS type A sorting domain-containing protein [Chitinophagales bacterium]|nr:T9SS type A sorting domain-containing protein [Chitinophagales bacterium]